VDATVPVAEGGEVLTDGEELAEGGGRTGKRVEPADYLGGADEEDETRPGVINMADFDGTLYFLDEKEIEYLQTEVKREYESDLRVSVIALLLDILEQQPDEQIRGEVADVLDNFMLHMLTGGQFRNVAFLLRESQVASQRAEALQPVVRDKLTTLPARLAHRSSRSCSSSSDHRRWAPCSSGSTACKPRGFVPCSSRPPRAWRRRTPPSW
jgi:hypothetical protein